MNLVPIPLNGPSSGVQEGRDRSILVFEELSVHFHTEIINK